MNERELERKTSLSESVDPALFLSKHVKKDSRTKRKLEVNIPTNNSKVNIVFMTFSSYVMCLKGMLCDAMRCGISSKVK